MPGAFLEKQYRVCYDIPKIVRPAGKGGRAALFVCRIAACWEKGREHGTKRRPFAAIYHSVIQADFGRNQAENRSGRAEGRRQAAQRAGTDGALPGKPPHGAHGCGRAVRPGLPGAQTGQGDVCLEAEASPQNCERVEFSARRTGCWPARRAEPRRRNSSSLALLPGRGCCRRSACLRRTQNP